MFLSWSISGFFFLEFFFPTKMAEATTKNQEVVVIDTNHELFLHRGDSPGVKLVTKVLEGDNYTHWSRSMVIAFKSNGQVRFH